MSKHTPGPNLTLDETNFRDFAQKAIAKYADKMMIADGMLWSRIIGEYERERTELAEALRDMMAMFEPRGEGQEHAFDAARAALKKAGY